MRKKKIIRMGVVSLLKVFKDACYPDRWDCITRTFKGIPSKKHRLSTCKHTNKGAHADSQRPSMAWRINLIKQKSKYLQRLMGVLGGLGVSSNGGHGGRKRWVKITTAPFSAAPKIITQMLWKGKQCEGPETKRTCPGAMDLHDEVGTL